MSRGRPMLFATTLAGGIFALDLVAPRGIAVPALYLLVIVTGWRVSTAGAVVARLGLVTALTVVGYLLSPDGADPWMAVANRIASLLVVGAVGVWRIAGVSASVPRWAALLLTAALVAVVFELDAQMPAGVTVAVLYAPLTLLVAAGVSRRAGVALGLAVTALTLVGWAVFPPGRESWMVLANRGISLVAIWAVAILALGAIVDATILCPVHGVPARVCGVLPRGESGWRPGRCSLYPGIPAPLPCGGRCIGRG